MEFPSQDRTVIIAIKGLPFSGTKDVCDAISRWAGSPIFRLDGILEELYEEWKYDATSMPFKEEDERLQRRAFSILRKVAKVQLELDPKALNCVIIDMSLYSTSQLDMLIDFSKSLGWPLRKLLIIECRKRHKYVWQKTAQWFIDYNEWAWFMPKSWLEIEKVIEDYDAKAWDQHFMKLQYSIDHRRLLLKRLVLDPDLDLDDNELSGSTSKERNRISSPFAKAIEHLLTDEASPPIVDYRKWRKQHVERMLTTLSTLSMNSNNIKDRCRNCIFVSKEVDHLLQQYRSCNKASDITINCGACEEQLITGSKGAYYACVSCNLALHKPCAEFQTHSRLYYDGISIAEIAYHFPDELTHTCKSCSSSSSSSSSTGGSGKGGFSYECGGCIFETHLKCHQVPTVVNSPHLDPHPLSIQLTTNVNQYHGMYYCKLCSRFGGLCSYYCVRCNSSYHLRCVHSPEELTHEHGGYLHLMKLMLPNSSPLDDDDDLQPAMFSSDRYIYQDDLWCDVCYEEIDADAAYYSCGDCPDYVAHIYCITPLWKDVPFSFI